MALGLGFAGPGRGRSATADPSGPPPVKPAASHSLEAAKPRVPSGDSLSLAEAIDLALEHNPLLKASRSNLSASRSILYQARKPPNPEMSAEMENLGGTWEDAEAPEVNFRLGQTWDPSRSRRARLAAADTGLASESLRRDGAELISRTRTDYLRAFMEQERLVLAEEGLALARRGHEFARRQVLAGKVSPLDSLLTRMALERAEMETAEMRDARRLSRRRLSTLWGGDSLRSFAGVKAPPEPAPLPPWPVLTAAIAGSPEWKYLEREELRSRAELELEKSRRLPPVTLGGGIKAHPGESGFSWAGELSLPLPLWNRNGGGIGAAHERWQARVQENAAMRRELEMRLEELHAKARRARETHLRMRQGLEPAARQAQEASLAGYAAGKFGGIDLLAAQEGYLKIRDESLQSFASYHLAVIDLERILGVSVESLAVPGAGAATERRNESSPASSPQPAKEKHHE